MAAKMQRLEVVRRHSEILTSFVRTRTSDPSRTPVGFEPALARNMVRMLSMLFPTVQPTIPSAVIARRQLKKCNYVSLIFEKSRPDW